MQKQEEKNEYVPEYVIKRGVDEAANYLFHKVNAKDANELAEIEDIEKDLSVFDINATIISD